MYSPGNVLTMRGTIHIAFIFHCHSDRKSIGCFKSNILDNLFINDSYGFCKNNIDKVLFFVLPISKIVLTPWLFLDNKLEYIIFCISSNPNSFIGSMVGNYSSISYTPPCSLINSLVSPIMQFNYFNLH